LDSIIEEIHHFPHAKIRNLVFVENDDHITLYLDCDGTSPGLAFAGLSGREKERVIIEFAAAYGRLCGKYGPTLVVLDSIATIFFTGWFDFYREHFLSPDCPFQTILTIPTQNLDLEKIRWNGWHILKTTGAPPNCSIEQI